MLRDKKDMKAQKQESELKIKLRAFYLQHNPAKLEFLNDIVKQMEENSLKFQGTFANFKFTINF